MSTPRPVPLTGTDERITTRLTVNGAPAGFTLPARVTLADALRDHLGLTGTHLGCEHGVCGMCTVLADGVAVRSCLLLACQADGTEITTVEGLGTPAEPHPLQESFGRNHALQCGFCTPGFLMTACDLLAHQPDIDPADLPAELSGVLCRCTGYRNIVAAVAHAVAVARTGHDHLEVRNLQRLRCVAARLRYASFAGFRDRGAPRRPWARGMIILARYIGALHAPRCTSRVPWPRARARGGGVVQHIRHLRHAGRPGCSGTSAYRRECHTLPRETPSHRSFGAGVTPVT